MPTRFSYAHARLALVQAAAARLRLMFPEISVTLSEQALELTNIPADLYARIIQAAAAELIGVSEQWSSVNRECAPEPVARAA